MAELCRGGSSSLCFPWTQTCPGGMDPCSCREGSECGMGRDECCSLCWWQLLGCTWKDLAPSPALMVLGAAQPCRPSWLLSAQILGSQGFSLTEAPGGVLSHPWPTADPASRPRALHFWVFPWFYCISSLQDVGLVFFPGLLFPV